MALVSWMIYSRKYKSYSLVLLNLFILMLADWFARKNLRRHSDIYNVYYYQYVTEFAKCIREIVSNKGEV